MCDCDPLSILDPTVGCPLTAKVTIFQLEKLYGKGTEAKAFIEELIRGSWAEVVGINLVHGLSFLEVQLTGWVKLFSHLRTGWCAASAGWVLHCVRGRTWPPNLLNLGQAPTQKKARMYKVLKEVIEDNVKGSGTDTTVSCLVEQLTCFHGS